MDLHNSLESIRHALHELETAARELPNQNFADIVASARGKLAQLQQHGDLADVGGVLRKQAEAERAAQVAGLAPAPFMAPADPTRGGPGIEQKPAE